jgi:two-component system, LytTR family, response regulator
MRVAIVEDEAVVARRLIRLVTKILGDQLERIDHLGSLSGARAHLGRSWIDLLFLDLNLRGRDGFRLLADAVSRPFDTVVVSAHHDQALRAFEYGVVDFVPKPFDQARLELAIGRVLDRGAGRDAVWAAARRGARYLAVRKAREVVPIPISEVLFVQGAGDFSELHCRDGGVHLHQKTLTRLEGILPTTFERIHRSFIVDVRAIRAFRAEEGSRYFVRLEGGQEVPVSRAKARALRARFA